MGMEESPEKTLSGFAWAKLWIFGLGIIMSEASWASEGVRYPSVHELGFRCNQTLFLSGKDAN
jgi:hypothetical protein